MPTPYVMHPELQGAFDSTLGRPEMLAGALCALVLRELEDSDSDNDSDSDSDSDDFTEVLAVAAIVAMHIARRLRASASLSLGGVSRVTDARVFDAHTCRLLFRFSAPQVDELAHRMGLHAYGTRVVSGHDVFAPQEALLITLYKLAFPQRLIEMVQLFNRHPSVLSRAFSWVVGVYKRRFDPWILGNTASKHDLERWRRFIPEWAAAARRKGLPFMAVGHLDGSRLEICRPGKYQEVLYNGYYGRHCLNFLSFVALCGLTPFLHGPACGMDHDGKLYDKSGLQRKLLRICTLFERAGSRLRHSGLALSCRANPFADVAHRASQLGSV
jgi:hypothetical protein